MKNRKRVAILMLFIVFLIKPNFAEFEKPKLRWEYKYQEGETLYYYQKVKVTYNENMQKKLKEQISFYKPDFKPNETESVEGVLTIKFNKDKEASDALAINTKFWMKDRPELPKQLLSENFKSEITQGLDLSVPIRSDGTRPDTLRNFAVVSDGSILMGSLQYYNVFLMGQPRFSESGLDLWNKTLNINYSAVTGHYRKLGEEIFKGRKCVVIETEIGQAENVTEGDTTKHIGETEMPGMIIKLKGKTWFDYEAGKILKMDLEKQMINYAGGLKKWNYYPNYEFSYELMDAAEIKKLDGIEESWELVLHGVNIFQLTRDGKIVYVKEDPIKNDEHDSSSISNGVKTASFIYICDGEGSNQKRLTQGTNPVLSPDGKWIAFKRDTELWIVDMDGKNSKIIADGFCQKIAKQIQWSPNNKAIGFVSCEGNLEIVYTEGKEEKKSIKVGNMDLQNISWSPQNDRIFFFIEEHFSYKGVFYKYDLKNNRLEEENSFKKTKGDWSPRELIYAVAGDKLSLIYYSEKGEMIKEEEIIDVNRENPVTGFYWSNNGKFLIFNTYEYFNIGKKEENALKRGYFVYSVKEHRIIWESKEDWGDFSFEKEWNYFGKKGKLTQSVNLYKTRRPQELIEAIDKAR